MMSPKRILVICHELVPAGGIYHFERTGRVLNRWSHEMAFVALGPQPDRWRKVDFPVLTFDQAQETQWDAVMLPGGGFPGEMVDRLDIFQDARFGRRVQHLLNDQTRKHAYLRAYPAFKPHFVLAITRNWPIHELQRVFPAEQVDVLEGAIDSSLFSFVCARRRSADEPLIIGGLASKNTKPLLQAALRLKNVKLRLFGIFTGDEADRDELIRQGRLELVGLLDEPGLLNFYSTVDLVVHTETFAGWANLAAEGLASGVPVICTPHGTLPFAEHGVTAWVVPVATADTLVEAIERLRDDPDLCRRMVAAGRERIRPYTWVAYAERLLQLTFGEQAGQDYRLAG